MSADATLLTTWCAVYGFAAAYYVALWSRTRRRDPEHVTYACVCIALAIYAAGGALLVDATTLAEATHALRVQYAGAFAVVAFFVDFTSHLIGRPRRIVVLASYGVAALGLVLDLSGRLLDPTRPATSFIPGLGAPGALLEPAFRVEGLLAVGAALTLALWAGAVLLRKARTDPDARVVVIGTTLGLAAGVYDTGARLLGRPAAHLVEHAGLVTVLTVGYVLLRRFVHAAGELEHRTNELARSYDELRRTQEELVRKEQLAAVGELSAVIAHEVRNPLAILKNAVSSLRRPTLTSADRGVLFGILDEETDRLNRLVRDLLAYARPVVPKGGSVDLRDLVLRAYELARGGRDDGSDVELEIDLDSAPSAIRGDPELLRHAFVNVIDNALQAMLAGGRLLVRATPSTIEARPAIALSFADSGDGMDTLVRAKALDPFFTTRPAGTGLGLAIVERVVKNHGGSLLIDSEPGAGTTVTLHLPVAE
ncbi:MAG: ATP-binding protein [Myxococcota bacterium]|nr:ATP-binding protein [Myxococcota bacterium]